jgi:hypothetical protein
MMLLISTNYIKELSSPTCKPLSGTSPYILKLEDLFEPTTSAQPYKVISVFGVFKALSYRYSDAGGGSLNIAENMALSSLLFPVKVHTVFPRRDAKAINVF